MKTPKQCPKGLALILILSRFGWGQADTAAMKVSLCDLYMNPQQYVGKMVASARWLRFVRRLLAIVIRQWSCHLFRGKSHVSRT